MRTRLANALKDAMKAKDSNRLSTLRLINAAVKDREIALRGDDSANGVSDAEILGILGKMIKQRHDSVKAYEEAGRLELAEGERGEIEGAESIRDMGKVMAWLKTEFAGQMDFGKVGGMVKDHLG